MIIKTMFFRHLRVVISRRHYRQLHYVQGQSPEPRIREYFYFIDHQGQLLIVPLNGKQWKTLYVWLRANTEEEYTAVLFLDDSKMKNFTSCFKEKKFLDFFFKRLKLNGTDRYQEEFPYLSPCGRERNYIRCDDRPIVYVHLTDSQTDGQSDVLTYGYPESSTLNMKFEPEKVCMLPESGRIYHPADPKLGGVGLIKSSIAIAISKHFEFNDGEDMPPTHFTWNGERYALTNELIPYMEMLPADAALKLEESEHRM